MNIFLNNAEKYWAKNLPVIPCKERDKGPVVANWSSFSTKMPEPEAQAAWLKQFPQGNIGLVLGQQANMCAIDIDTDDEKVIKVLDSVLPPSPWHRVGKKGSVRMYRFAGHRTFRIIAMDGKPIVELLSKGAQVIIPPSIHPSTGRAYEANTDLSEVVNQLCPLPKDIETILREALVDAGVSLSTKGSTKLVDFVSSGSRDSSMVSHAGLMARAVLRGERTIKEGLGELRAWLDTYVEKVVGDDISPEKAEQKFISFLVRDVTEGNKTLPEGWDLGLSNKEKEDLREAFGEAALEEWSSLKIIEHITEKFAECEGNQTDMIGVIDAMLVRLSRQKNLSKLEEDSVLKFCSTASGGLANLGVMRVQLQNLRKGEILGENHAELADELAKELQRYGEVRFHNGSFYQWAGDHWKILENHVIYKMVAEEFGHYPAARKAGDHKGIITVLASIVPQQLQEKEVTGVNFANGFLTSDLELLPHDPKYGATTVLPYRWLPELEGHCPKFRSFLDDCWGHEGDDFEFLQTSLLEAIATTMFGVAYQYSRAVCLYGVPHSGKSVLTKIILGLIPSGAICNVPPQTWSDKFMVTEMADRTLNMCGELSEDKNIAGDKFKQIVEGDQIQGQYKGQQIFNFKPTCAHWFASNHLPKTNDTSAGFNRRWLIFPFNRSVPRERKIVGLEQMILSEEREALIAWALPYIKRIRQRQDYTLSQGHIDCVGELANANNSVRHFFSIRTERVASEKTSNLILEKDLFAAYYNFCRVQASVRPVILKKFRLMALELQQEFNFKFSKRSLNGQEIGEYSGVTLVGVEAV